MAALRTTNDSGSAPERHAAPSRAERESLLRALLLSRGLERSLAIAGYRAPRLDPLRDLCAAVGAAAALHPADALFTSHDLLTAHVTRGAAPADLLAARLGRKRSTGPGAPLAAAAPGSVVPLAAGAALSISAVGAPQLAVAIVAREWLEDEPSAGALRFARERRLPLSVIAIGGETDRPSGPELVGRDQPEAVQEATRAMLAAVREGSGGRVLECQSLTGESERGEAPDIGPGQRDALRRYEHRLSVHGFSRRELSRIRTSVLAEVREAAAIGLSRRAAEA